MNIIVWWVYNGIVDVLLGYGQWPQYVADIPIKWWLSVAMLSYPMVNHSSHSMHPEIMKTRSRTNSKYKWEWNTPG